MGGSEILLILLAVLLLFGADKLPDFARSLGKGIREVKKATDEITTEITKETSQFKDDLSQAKNSMGVSEIDEFKKDLDKNIN